MEWLEKYEILESGVGLDMDMSSHLSCFILSSQIAERFWTFK